MEQNKREIDYLLYVSIFSLVYLVVSITIFPVDKSILYGSLFGAPGTILGVLATVYLLPRVIKNKRWTSYFLYFLLKVLIFAAFFIIPFAAINYNLERDKTINIMLQPVNIFVLLSYSFIPIIISIVLNLNIKKKNGHK